MLRVTSSPGDLAGRARASADAAGIRLRAELEQLAPTATAAIERNAPRAVTGAYDASVGATVTGATLTVGVGARHAAAVERGRQAGTMPPPAVIGARLGLDPRQAFLVARAIGRRGTPAQRVVEQALTQLRPAVQQTAARAASRLGSLG